MDSELLLYVCSTYKCESVGVLFHPMFISLWTLLIHVHIGCRSHEGGVLLGMHKTLGLSCTAAKEPEEIDK